VKVVVNPEPSHYNGSQASSLKVRIVNSGVLNVIFPSLAPISILTRFSTAASISL